MTDLTREQFIEAATKIHDGQGCACDRRYLMSCQRLTAAILGLAASSISGADAPAADLPRIDSLEVAAQQPNAMVNDAGEVFYPDGPEDAEWFARKHGARLMSDTWPSTFTHRADR